MLLLPFIESSRISTAFQQRKQGLTLEERRRNAYGCSVVSVGIGSVGVDSVGAGIGVGVRVGSVGMTDMMLLSLGIGVGVGVGMIDGWMLQLLCRYRSIVLT